MNVGDLVLRTPLQRFGNRGVVVEVHTLNCRIRWSHTHKSNLIRQSAVRVVTPEEFDAEYRRVVDQKRQAIAHYKYCAVHHQQLNGDGTCVQCAAIPATIYTAGDTTARAYDGPEK